MMYVDKIIAVDTLLYYLKYIFSTNFFENIENANIKQL